MAIADVPGTSMGFLLQGQTLEVLIDEPPPSGRSDEPPRTPFKLGIVSMIKQPGAAILETWLTYHAEVVGAEQFYLRVEDTPSLAELLQEEPWCECVSATFHEGTEREWSGVATRQAHHVRASIEAARRGERCRSQ